MKFIINENNLIKGFNNYMDYEFSKLLKFNRIPTRPSSIFFYDKHSGEIIFEIDNSKKTKRTFFIINWGFFETLNNMFPYNSPGLGKIGVDSKKLLINWAKEKLSDLIFYDDVIFDFDEYDITSNSIFDMAHIQGVDLNNNQY
jgi:hypothetical protein